MSILTKEQQPFEKLREILYRYRGLIDESDESELLSIIDDLQARALKQYTEQELREAFDKVYPPFQGVAHEQIFKGWLMCAKSVGALKAEP